MLLLASACSTTVVDRAIRARGGSLESVRRDVQASVYQGMPGTWSWEMAYAPPERFRWTLHTYGDEQSYLYDGRTAVMLLGGAALPVEPAALASFRSQARWTAVTTLDVLRDASLVGWRELPRAELPPGASRGIEARFLDDPATYRLYLDAADLLIAAEGPISVPMVGNGRLHVDYRDFRAVDGFLLPFAGTYLLDGRPLMDEQVRRWVADDPALGPAAFTPAAPR